MVPKDTPYNLVYINLPLKILFFKIYEIKQTIRHLSK